MRPRAVAAARTAALGLALAVTGCALVQPRFPEAVPVEHVAAGPGPLRAGAAAVDVTPQGRVWMGGFGFWRRSDGVHDPLHARALVLERGGVQLALVAVDVVGLQREDLLPWRRRLAKLGFDPRFVLIAATHNHSGPDTVGLWGLPPVYSGQSEAVMERIEEGVVEALLRARDALRPAELAAAAPAIDPAGILKNLRRPGLVDPHLAVVHVREAGGGPTIATLVELGVHPEVLGGANTLLTADFPGVETARLESRLGGVAIHVSGALGGLVTPDVAGGFPEGEGGTWEEAQRVGTTVADRAAAIVAGLGRYDAQPAVAAWHAPLHLRNRNFRYDLVRWTGVLDRTMVRGGYLRTEVNLWDVGPLRVASVPGEITPDLGLRIRALARGRPTVLVGLGNDELGYLLPASEFDLPIYGYERTLSPGREAGDRIVSRLEDLSLLAESRSGASARSSRSAPRPMAHQKNGTIW